MRLEEEVERLQGLEGETAKLRTEGDAASQSRRGLEAEVERLRGLEEEEGGKRRALEEVKPYIQKPKPTTQTPNPNPLNPKP